MKSSDDLQELIAALEATPNKLSQLIAGLSTANVRWKPGEEFSIIENICHLRDLEVEGYTSRIRRIINEQEPVLSDIDGARLAVERDYQNDDVVKACDAFAQARSENVRLFNGIGLEQLRRTAILEGVGRITLENLLRMMQEHDEGHLNDIRQMRRVVPGVL